jgi:FtsP/CotA-like multicopper oxidase with cupredoxin domain
VKAPPSLAQVEEAARAAKGEATGLPPPPPPPGGPPRPAFKEPLAYEVDAPVLLFDNYHAPYNQLEDIYASATLNPEGVEPVPNSVLINGIGQGYCGGNTLNGTVSGAGQPPCNWALIKAVASPCSAPKTRLRLINGGAFAPVDVFIDGVSVFVVEIDAVRVNPVFVPGPVRLNIGQRVAVAICVDGEAPDSVLMRVAMDQVRGGEGAGARGFSRARRAADPCPPL